MPDTLRNQAERAVRACANDIVAGFHRERIPLEICLAITGTVVGQLIDQMPAGDRMDWARHFCDCLLAGTRDNLDA